MGSDNVRQAASVRERRHGAKKKRATGKGCSLHGLSGKLVGREWLEHSTYGLRVRCSTN